jgi:hypothetical protein
MTEWQSPETAPRDMYFLGRGFDKHAKMPFVGECYCVGGFYYQEFIASRNRNHISLEGWMPLPQYPESKESQNEITER